MKKETGEMEWRAQVNDALRRVKSAHARERADDGVRLRETR